jgi:hypothetical protein
VSLIRLQPEQNGSVIEETKLTEPGAPGQVCVRATSWTSVCGHDGVVGGVSAEDGGKGG